VVVTTQLLGTAQTLLWAGTLVACAALVGRVFIARLHKTFFFLFIYLVVRLVRGVGLYYIPYRSKFYGPVWAASAPLLWVLQVLIVLEIYSLVLRNYPGIASLGRWMLTGGLVIAIGLSGLSLQADFANPNEGVRRVLYFTAIERGVMTSLAIFLLLNTAFLVWYPVPLSRNVVVHSMVCAVYFLGATMGLLVRNVAGHQVTMAVNVGLSTVDLACLIMWAALLSRAGETETVVLGHRRWRPQQQQRLMDQLATINATLLRTARRPENWVESSHGKPSERAGKQEARAPGLGESRP